MIVPEVVPNSVEEDPLGLPDSSSHSECGAEPGVRLDRRDAKSLSATNRPCCCAADAKPGGPITSPTAYTLFSEFVLKFESTTI